MNTLPLPALLLLTIAFFWEPSDSRHVDVIRRYHYSNKDGSHSYGFEVQGTNQTEHGRLENSTIVIQEIPQWRISKRRLRKARQNNKGQHKTTKPPKVLTTKATPAPPRPLSNIPPCPANSDDGDAVCVIAPILGGYRCYCVPLDEVNSHAKAEAACKEINVGNYQMKLASFKSQYDIVQISQVLDKPLGYDYEIYNLRITGSLDLKRRSFRWADGSLIDISTICDDEDDSNATLANAYLDTENYCIRPLDPAKDEVNYALCAL